VYTDETQNTCEVFDMHSRIKGRFIFAGFFCLCISGITNAQTSKAQITGAIRDSTEAAVAGANVRLRAALTGIERETVANELGVYTVPILEPGEYVLSVSSPGFQTVTRSGIRLDVNQTARVDFVLQPGVVTETIEVSAGAPLVESSSAQLGTVVTEEKIADLPLNARNFTQLLTITPGVSPISVTQNAGGNEVQAVGIRVFPAVNGQTNRSNSFTLDGIVNNGHFTGTYAVAPSIDALNQFKVQAHSDLAEFGGGSGGIINISSKSGTNQFHGSVYEFLRNDKLDARAFFSAGKPPLRQNQFGAAGGGPIIRNRTFFFASYEGYRQQNASSRLALIPTPAELSGDFRQERRTIYDPYSTRVDPTNANRFLRNAFPNQQIPRLLFSPSTKALAESIIPAPIDTGFAGFNARNSNPQRFPANNYSARVDHQLTPSDFIWGRYTWGTQDQISAEALPGHYTSTAVDAKNLGFSYVRLLGSSTVINALFGFASATVEDTPGYTTSDRNLAAEGFFKGYPDLLAWRLPSVAITGFFTTSDLFRKLGPQRSYQYNASLSHNRGAHTLKFGGEAISMPWANAQQRGRVSFNTRQTADLNNLGNTGSAAASFVLGVHESASVSLPDFAMTSQIWNFYIQDSWKVSDRLTVNLGLRWDLLRNADFTKDFASTWDLNNGTFLVGASKPDACSVTRGIPPCLPNLNDPYVNQYVIFTGDSKLIKDDYKMFAPRLGIAYRLRPTTVIRSTFAIFHDTMNAVTQRAQNGNIGNANWPGSRGRTVATINQNFVEATADAAFGEGDPFDVLPNPRTVSTGYFDPLLKQPYSIQWNFDVQQQIGDQLNLAVAYVGSHNLRMNVGGVYNTALTPGPGPVAGRNLFPHAPVTRWERAIGQSWYNALQAKGERRFARGFSALVAYTWSKSIDLALSGWSRDDMSLPNAYDLNASRGVSGFDITHYFSSAIVYELPFGRGKKWIQSGLASTILGNWQVNTIVQLRSGQPYTPLMNVDIANVGGQTANERARPDLLRNPHLPNPTIDRWFDTSAFAAPAQFTYGTAGRNILRSDSLQNMDFSVFREDQISERFRLQIRAEAFNLMNHPTFGEPQSTFTNRLFGQVSGTDSTARQVQLGIRLHF
jgi:hypothetical protein